MPQSQKLSPLDDLHQRIDAVAKCKERLEQEIHSILASGKVAPASCWIVRPELRDGLIIIGITNYRHLHQYFPQRLMVNYLDIGIWVKLVVQHT